MTWRAGQLAICIVALIAGLSADAARGEPPGAAEADEVAPPAAPSPHRDATDWIQFDSGEWLRGEIKLLRNENLEFESDELDLLTLDWDDVVELRSGRIHTYVLDDLSAVKGTAVMAGGEIAVDVGGDLRRYPRERLVAIVSGEPTEIDHWYARGFAGLSADSGNTDMTTVSAELLLRRETPKTRAQLQYNGAYGIVDHEKTTNNHRGFSRFDVFLTRYFFLSPALFEAFSDEFENVSYRLSPGTGVGYILIQTPETDWEATGAVGYVYTRFDSAQPGDSQDRESGALIIGTRFEQELTDRLDFLGSYRAMVTAPDFGQTSHHGEATLSLEVTSFLDLDTKFVWDRTESPARESDGRRPDRNDFRLAVGISLDY